MLIADHRLALTRLLCGSFFLRGLRTDTSAHAPASLLCRKCETAPETPGHVFWQCRAAETVAARVALETTLQQEFNISIARVHSSMDGTKLLQALIFDWNTVVPMARFIYKVARSWRGFGRRLPTMVSEMAPDSEGEEGWDIESATEDGSVDGGWDMEVD